MTWLERSFFNANSMLMLREKTYHRFVTNRQVACYGVSENKLQQFVLGYHKFNDIDFDVIQCSGS